MEAPLRQAEAVGRPEGLSQLLQGPQEELPSRLRRPIHFSAHLLERQPVHPGQQNYLLVLGAERGKSVTEALDPDEPTLVLDIISSGCIISPRNDVASAFGTGGAVGVGRPLR